MLTRRITAGSEFHRVPPARGGLTPSLSRRIAFAETLASHLTSRTETPAQPCFGGPTSRAALVAHPPRVTLPLLLRPPTMPPRRTTGEARSTRAADQTRRRQNGNDRRAGGRTLARWVGATRGPALGQRVDFALNVDKSQASDGLTGVSRLFGRPLLVLCIRSHRFVGVRQRQTSLVGADIRETLQWDTPPDKQRDKKRVIIAFQLVGALT